MNLLRRLARRHAWLAALLLVLATGARAAVPQGWMPEAQAGGALHLIPCDGTAPVPAPMAGMHHGHAMDHGEDGHAPHHADQPCAFAGMLGPLLLHAALAEVPAISIAAVEFTHQYPGPTTLAARSVRPPSRGPPYLV